MYDLSLFVINYSYEPEICNGCNDISMMVYELETIAILNVKGVDYRYVIWNMNRNDAINLLNNSKLYDKDSLWIGIFEQIKRLLK